MAKPDGPFFDLPDLLVADADAVGETVGFGEGDVDTCAGDGLGDGAGAVTVGGCALAVGLEPACAELAAVTPAGPGEALNDGGGTTGALLIAELGLIVGLGDRLGVPAGSRNFAAASPAGVVALAVGRGAGNP